MLCCCWYRLCCSLKACPPPPPPTTFLSMCRYRPAARTKSDVDSGTSNQGFRCAADPDNSVGNGGEPGAKRPGRGRQEKGGAADASAASDRAAGAADVEIEEL